MQRSLKSQNMYANYTIKDLIYMAKNYTEEIGYQILVSEYAALGALALILPHYREKETK
jgi:hypothetical protein